MPSLATMACTYCALVIDMLPVILVTDLTITFPSVGALVSPAVVGATVIGVDVGLAVIAAAYYYQYTN